MEKVAATKRRTKIKEREFIWSQKKLKMDKKKKYKYERFGVLRREIIFLLKNI